VCIRIWDWSETSQTVSLFARDLGILRGIAKGAKREGAPFSGGLETLTRGEVVAIVKSNERSPDGLATLTAWDLQETFPAARRALPAFHAGLYMLDLVHHAVRDADPHPGLYDGLLAALRGLEIASGVPMTLARFQWLAIKECGFTPELDRDVRTQGVLVPAATYGFSATLGGFLADPGGGSVSRGTGANDRANDEASDGASDPGPIWRVRAGTIEFLRGLDSLTKLGSEPEILTSDPNGPGEPGGAVGRANRLLAMYFQTVLGRWPLSVHTVFPGISGGESRGGA